MSRKSIAPEILNSVVSEASPLSEDERVRSAYPELATHRNYHAFVGGALSDHHVELGIAKVRTKARRGMQWQKKGRQA